MEIQRERSKFSETGRRLELYTYLPDKNPVEWGNIIKAAEDILKLAGAR